MIYQLPASGVTPGSPKLTQPSETSTLVFTVNVAAWAYPAINQQTKTPKDLRIERLRTLFTVVLLVVSSAVAENGRAQENSRRSIFLKACRCQHALRWDVGW